MESERIGFTPDRENTRPKVSWFRLLVYGGLLAFLAALLYREANLERPLISLPVLFVCLAGVSHILSGFNWRNAVTRTVWGWSRWVFAAIGVLSSLRLLFPV